MTADLPLLRSRLVAAGLLALILSACHTAPPANPSAPEPTPALARDSILTRVTRATMSTGRPGSLDQFVALVPAFDSGMTCLPPPPRELANGQRTLWYTLGDPRARPVSTLTRSVVVTLNSYGLPINYSDGRGDLRGRSDPSVPVTPPPGPRTIIAIDLVEMVALLSNEQDGRAVQSLTVQSRELLTAPSLGNPAAMIQHIRDTCDRP